MGARVSPVERDSGIRPAYRIYVGLLTGATLLIVFPVGLEAAAAEPVSTILWIGFLAAANLLTIPMSPRLNLDASLGAPVSVAAAVILFPPLATLVNFLGFANPHEWRRGTSVWLILFNRSQMALSAWVASLAAHGQPYGRLAGTVLAVAVYNVANVAALTVHVRLRRQTELISATKTTAAPFPHFLVDFGLVTLLAVLVVIANEQVGPLAVLLLALPLWLGYSALRSAREAQDRAELLALRVRELETLHALGTELLSVRDPARAAEVGRRALVQALDTEEVAVALGGDLSPSLQPVKIPGAEPALLGVPHELGAAPLAVAEAIAGLLGMAIQRVGLELELTEVERARTALSARILEEGTRERSRIALQIHDDVLPYLAAAEIQADNVRSALGGDDGVRADRLAVATRDAVHDGIARLRDVLQALRRQIVVPGGLLPGLEEALEEVRLQHGVRGRLEAPTPFPELPLAVEILVLETVRGCLTNVARHAEADEVVVQLQAGDRMLSVQVRDDGCGFEPGTVPAERHGLALMQQRVELARGRFAIETAPGAGTAVRMEVPV